MNGGLEATIKQGRCTEKAMIMGESKLEYHVVLTDMRTCYFASREKKSSLIHVYNNCALGVR